MIKREIKFEDLEGEEISDVFYFRLNDEEWLEFNGEYEGGLENFFKRAVQSNDINHTIKFLKDIILKSYGIKAEDGRRFIKNAQIREEFTQLDAFNVLFMDLATNEKAGLDFIKELMPKGLRAEFDKNVTQQQTASALSVVEPNKE